VGLGCTFVHLDRWSSACCFVAAAVEEDSPVLVLTAADSLAGSPEAAQQVLETARSCFGCCNNLGMPFCKREYGNG